MHFRTHVAVLLMLMVVTLACQQQPASPPDTRAADESAIRAAETEWSSRAFAKDLEGILSYYAEDASMFPPNAPIATGKEAIRKAWSEMLALPNLALSWRTVKAEAARSGDLGYSHGTYEMSFDDPKGKPVKDRGKYAAVWKKQADGSWKAVADIFNSDQPPPKM